MDKVPLNHRPTHEGGVLVMAITATGWVGPEGEAADGGDIPPGSMEFPPCQCTRHRFRAPVTDPVLSAKVAAVNDREEGEGRGVSRAVFRFEPYTTRQDDTVEPEYRAVCVAGDEEPCGAVSGVRGSAVEVDDWMRRHMAESKHHHFKRSFDDYAELLPTSELPAELEPARVKRVRS
ncbi:DUF7848 domain-containing protein [Streptomyces jumonjinensis]|uniref:DUF7848 domain-containing protein n=1 Tax=Streptomyces jumonjinensis TaxID=1945 RepID=UPI00379677A5